MANQRTQTARSVTGMAMALALVLAAPMAGAQTASQRGADKGQYIPTIWVDPDGCEHWVMDDGAEGYMTPNVSRQGIPVCHRGNLCGVMPTDQFFATDSAKVHKAGRDRLQQFFRGAGARSYIITGHTDARASDAYNLRLSEQRANAVARIAQESGARISGVRAYGERKPRATNRTAAGQAKNRRVEIICIK